MYSQRRIEPAAAFFSSSHVKVNVVGTFTPTVNVKLAAGSWKVELWSLRMSWFEFKSAHTHMVLHAMSPTRTKIVPAELLRVGSTYNMLLAMNLAHDQVSIYKHPLNTCLNVIVEESC
jgi:hypothetical protein